MHIPSWRTIKARLPALLAFLSTLLGVLTSIEVLPLLPGTVAGKPTGAVLLALGAIVAAFTRPVYGPAAARAGAQYRQAPPAPPTPEHPERATGGLRVDPGEIHVDPSAAGPYRSVGAIERELRLERDEPRTPPFDHAG